ncbi:MAG: hypothetical protein OXI96_00515 [Acidimicrobiaceae bacterium]|nr:hypothetical protein [Acidimicrobiaceae bacterium]
MNDKTMTPDEEHEFYSKPENQAPQGSARRRKEQNTVSGARAIAVSEASTGFEEH